MPFFADMFIEPGQPIEYKGKKIYSADFIYGPKEFKAIVSMISTNSEYKQGLSFNMTGMKGKLTYDGHTLTEGGYKFWEDKVPKEFTVDVKIEEGVLLINNFCDNTGTGSCVSGFSGFAMRIENIRENKKRYYCNDFEPNDDFDDLIFEIEFIESEK